MKIFQATSYKELSGWSHEMYECESVDPELRIKYYNTAGEIASEKIIRLQGYLVGKRMGNPEKPPLLADQLQKRDAPSPQFSLPDLGGQLHTLSSLRGGWVLLNFWGTWCPGCIDGLPA